MDVNDHKTYDWIRTPLLKHKSDFLAAITATVVNNTLQIFTSLFVMVVYNRIIPNRALDTLVTVTVGITLLILFDTPQG